MKKGDREKECGKQDMSGKKERGKGNRQGEEQDRDKVEQTEDMAFEIVDKKTW